MHTHTHTLAGDDVHRLARERPQGVVYTIQGSLPHGTVAGIPPASAAALRLGIERCERKAMTLGRKRELHAHQGAGYAACARIGKGICKLWQEGRKSGSTGRQGEREERDRKEEENAGEPVSPPRAPWQHVHR